MHRTTLMWYCANRTIGIGHHHQYGKEKPTSMPLSKNVPRKWQNFCSYKYAMHTSWVFLSRCKCQISLELTHFDPFCISHSWTMHWVRESERTVKHHKLDEIMMEIIIKSRSVSMCVRLLSQSCLLQYFLWRYGTSPNNLPTWKWFSWNMYELVEFIAK